MFQAEDLIHSSAKLFYQSEGRGFVFVFLNSSGYCKLTAHLDSIFEADLQIFQPDNIESVFDSIFQTLMEKTDGKIKNFQTVLYIDLPWIHTTPEINASHLEISSDQDNHIIKIDDASVSLNYKISETTRTSIFSSAGKTEIPIAEIFPAENIAWSIIAEKLIENPVNSIYTINGILTGSKLFHQVEPSFEFISFHHEFDKYDETKILNYIDDKKLLEHYKNDFSASLSVNSLISLVKNKSILSRIFSFEYKQKIQYPALKASKLAYNQLIYVALRLGIVLLTFLLIFFTADFLYSENLSQSVEWKTLNSKQINEYNRLSKFLNKEQKDGIKLSGVSGFQSEKLLVLSDGLTNNIKLSSWQFSDEKEFVNKLTGFTNSEIDISKYLTALNQTKAIKSAQLQSLLPINKQNALERAQSSGMKLKFIIRVELND